MSATPLGERYVDLGVKAIDQDDLEKALRYLNRALSLDANLRAAGTRFPMARLLTAQDNRLAVDTAESLYRLWAQNSGERRATFRELGRGMAEVMRVYLELLAGQFHSRTIAEQWRESYAVFLRDLERAIDRVRF